MFPQTDKSWHDYSALNQNWSYQPTWQAMQFQVTVKILNIGTCMSEQTV